MAAKEPRQQHHTVNRDSLAPSDSEPAMMDKTLYVRLLKLIDFASQSLWQGEIGGNTMGAKLIQPYDAPYGGGVELLPSLEPLRRMNRRAIFN